jgi:nucleoid-associated protein YgaU
VLPASATLPPSSPSVTESVVVREGDSWWSIAEAAYGDGRLYKALFAWNRTLDRRVSLTPGNRLEIPPASQLKAAWAKLVPAE